MYLSYMHCNAQMLAQSLSAKQQNYDAETNKDEVYYMLQEQRTKKCHLVCFTCLATCNYSVRSK